MAKHAGIRSRFKLENASGTVIDISGWITDVAGSSSQEWLDVTTLQPDAATPLKDEIPGFSSKAKTLTGMWSEEVEAFFSALEGDQNLTYEETPAAGDGVDTTITGNCSCGGYTGPNYGVGTPVTFSVELRLQTRSLSGSPA